MKNFKANYLFSIILTGICINILYGCGSGSSNSVSPQVIGLQAIANQYFESYATTQGFSAFGITAQCKGFNNSQPATVFAGTMGYQSVDPRPVANDAIWQIGSNSKSFIAIVLVQLASDSKYNFSLDDPITKWLPQYSYFNWNGQIPTVRQILHMIGGIPNDSTQNWNNWYLNNLYVYMSPETMISTFASQSLDFQPGSAYNYSNTGYQMLGLLIEKITGNSAKSEVTNRVIIPAGLHNTYFVDNLPTDAVSKNSLVHGYYYASESAFETSSNGIDVYLASLSGEFFGAGNIISTTSDMNQYYRALFTTNILLNNQQFQELTALVSEDTGQPISSPSSAGGYGLGIGALNLKEITLAEPSLLQGNTNIAANLNKYTFVYNYTGGTLGFMFNNYYNPANSTSVVFTVNSEDLPGVAPILFKVINYLEPICKVQ